jgi:hypothetical protein
MENHMLAPLPEVESSAMKCYFINGLLFFSLDGKEAKDQGCILIH